MVINAVKGSCFISPVDMDSENIGLFALRKIEQGQVLWSNGRFETLHSTVCYKLGVEPKASSDPTRRTSNRSSSSVPKFVPSKNVRHIHSFLQSDRDLVNEQDFGSQANMETLWCDLG